jgi:WD40 repeat protein
MEYNSKTNELLALGLDKRITYWSINEQKLVKQLQAGFGADINSMSMSPDGQLIVVGDDIGEMKLFTYQDC